MPEKPSISHLNFLDSIRGFAALFVIASHYVLSYGLPCKDALCDMILTESALHFWWDGYAAVSMFFVLSGFVLTIKFFKDNSTVTINNFNLSEYWIARFFRIWPAYSIVLCLSWWLKSTMPLAYDIRLLPQQEWIFRFWQELLTPLTIIKEVLLIFPSQELTLLPHAWTLSIELLVSFVVPVGVLLVNRSVSWLIALTLFVIIFMGASPFILHFMLGILIAKWHKKITRVLDAHSLWKLYTFVSGIFLYVGRFSWILFINKIFNIEMNDNLIWAFTGLGSTLIIISVLVSTRLKSFLSKPLFVALGKISYSFYLLHFCVLMCVTPWVLSSMNLVEPLALKWFLGLSITIAVTIFFSFFMYKCIEIPGIYLGKYLAKQIVLKNSFNDK
ncbi:MAG: acyltransferase [Pseudomonadota bacterium]